MLPVSASRTPRLPLAALILGLLTAVLAALLVPASPTTAAAPDPRTDYYQIPQGCAGPARPEAQVPKGCRLTPWVRGRPAVVLWGDSHAWQQIPALIRAAKAERVNLTAFVMGKCPPAKVRIQKRYPGKCEQSNALALRYVRKRSQRGLPVQVILGSHWAGFRQAYRRLFVTETTTPEELGYDAFDVRMVKLAGRRTEPLFPALRKTRARIATIGQTATCQKRAGTAPFWCTMPRNDAILHETRTRRWLADVSRRAPQIDVNKPFCGPTRCLGRVDGIYTFWDWGHLSLSRNRLMGPLFRPVLRSLRR